MLNVTGVMGAMSGTDSIYNSISNFTYMDVGFALEPHEEMTIAYDFHIPIWVPADKRYRVAHTVFYEEVDTRAAASDVGGGGGQRYASTFQNTTTELYANDAEALDGSSMFMLFVALLATSVMLYVMYIACLGAGADEKELRRAVRNRSTAYGMGDNSAGSGNGIGNSIGFGINNRKQRK